jgi:hypothetical protein
LIDAVLKKEGGKSLNLNSDGKKPEDDQSLSSLLRFLINVVLQQTTDPSSVESEAKKEAKL